MKQVSRLPLAVFNDSVPQSVLDTIGATDRLTPMLAGATCIRQNGDDGILVVRTPGADVEVAAPTALLDLLFSLCDGTLTVDEVLGRITPTDQREEFAAFMGFLFEQGALIDGSLACAHAVRYGFQFSPFGLAAPVPVTDRIAPRFLWNDENAPSALPRHSVRVTNAPLDPFFADRTSLYTYDDKPVSEKALHRLLWSAAGVVNATHPRSGTLIPQRTLASAGAMHLLQIYVALRRTVGRYTPGVYRVTYPGERLVALTCINECLDTLPLTNTKPWQLTYATGVIFVAADPVVGAMRYRNRSLQYLFMEAGAALHNVALSANALGIGQATLGGYYERPSLALCALDERHVMLGTALFGARATARQLDRVPDSPTFDFAWVESASPYFKMSFHLARAKIMDGHDERHHTWGRDADPMLAMRKALAEAIEREGYCQPRNIVEGTLADIPKAIDPTTHPIYIAEQYDRPGFPFERFDPARTHAWVQARDLATGKKVHVLAELVFARSALRQAGVAADRPFTQETSSGCAAGVDLKDATTRAMREVIERDAFMRHWLTQTPGDAVPVKQWPRALRERVQAIEDTGCRVLLQRLHSPWLHVALVSVQHETRHFTTLGAAAGTDFTQAVDGALDETESRVYAWLHGHAPTVATPDAAVTPEDHFSIYGLEPHFRRADAVLFPEEPRWTTRWPRPLANRSLDDMVRRFGQSGLASFAVDITPDKHHVDQGRTPLRVARVLVPGLIPISFGLGREPLATLGAVHPDALFPHPFP